MILNDWGFQNLDQFVDGRELFSMDPSVAYPKAAAWVDDNLAHLQYLLSASLSDRIAIAMGSTVLPDMEDTPENRQRSQDLARFVIKGEQLIHRTLEMGNDIGYVHTTLEDATTPEIQSKRNAALELCRLIATEMLHQSVGHPIHLRIQKAPAFRLS